MRTDYEDGSEFVTRKLPEQRESQREIYIMIVARLVWLQWLVRVISCSNLVPDVVNVLKHKDIPSACQGLRNKSVSSDCSLGHV